MTTPLLKPRIMKSTARAPRIVSKPLRSVCGPRAVHAQVRPGRRGAACEGRHREGARLDEALEAAPGERGAPHRRPEW